MGLLGAVRAKTHFYYPTDGIHYAQAKGNCQVDHPRIIQPWTALVLWALHTPQNRLSKLARHLERRNNKKVKVHKICLALGQH